MTTIFVTNGYELLCESVVISSDQSRRWGQALLLIVALKEESLAQ